jgi:hypothetical protein
VLAATPDRATQVVRLGALAWGVQFHPEVDHALVCEWAEEDRSASAERSDGRAARDPATPDRSASAERSDGRAARDPATPDRSASAKNGDGAGVDLDHELQQLKDTEEQLLRTGRMFAEAFARIVREDRR